MRKTETTVILYDENYPEDLDVAKLISKALKASKFTKTKIVGDGCIVGRNDPPQGKHFESDNNNLIIIGEEPFGSGLMAPSIITYVTDDLQAKDLFFPKKTAVVTQESMIRLNKLFDSQKFKIFGYEEGGLDQLIAQLADYFGFEKAKTSSG